MSSPFAPAGLHHPASLLCDYGRRQFNITAMIPLLGNIGKAQVGFNV
jgi:hypothetical protein